MKWIVSFLLLVTFHSTTACECVETPFSSRYQSSDFIAVAKILSVDTGNLTGKYRDINIEVVNLYKGRSTATLKLDNHLFSNCGIYTPQNTLWLIFASADSTGVLHFGACSGSLQMDGYKISVGDSVSKARYESSLKLKIELLSFLRDEGLTLLNKDSLGVRFASNFINDTRGYEVKTNKFSVYELTIGKDLSVKQVKTIKSFDNADLSGIMLTHLKRATIFKQIGKELTEESKIILLFFYFPAKGKQTSFISLYAL